MSPAIDRTPDAAWFKSSRSGANETECVECAYIGNAALVRDSKRTSGPVLQVPMHSWHAFIQALTQGELGPL
ncbi:DUF397 domain-containing protein [Streptomyces sp. NPDC088253]|uniref:DUF397 domain-containing protein n=1 Tax=Streptomyces sp. NPDC088253 TaxID=3365846 RepID=UPI003829CDE5